MDERLRELQRAANQDPSLKSVYLNALVRANELPRSYLRFAAVLHYQPAIAAIGEKLYFRTIASLRLNDPHFADELDVNPTELALNRVIERLPFEICAQLAVNGVLKYTTEGFEEITTAIPLLETLIGDETPSEELVEELYTLGSDVEFAQLEWSRGFHDQIAMQRLFPRMVETIIRANGNLAGKTNSEYPSGREYNIQMLIDDFRKSVSRWLADARERGEHFAQSIGHRAEERFGWGLALEYQVEQLVELLLTPSSQQRKNPSEGLPIISIGYSPDYSWQLDRVLDDMKILGWENLHKKMLNREFDVYDMATVPEKGDARDHIRPETPLIIALHLYGMRYDDRYHYSSGPGYMYNQGNYKIYLLAHEWNIPLMVLGDQPEDKPTWGEETFTQQYFTDKAN